MKVNSLAKKANILFFSVVLISISVNIFVSLLSVKGIELPILANLIISQMIIFLPGLIYYVAVEKTDGLLVSYNKLKPVSILLLIVFTWLIMPLASVANIFSQLFSENEIISISGEILNLPFPVMLFIIGIFGPFSEEFVFRGLLYNSLKKASGRYLASGIVSALFFGLMHMNFNQFCYAFLLGIIFALINEVLDSAWPSFICHAVVNSQNVIMLYATNKLIMRDDGAGIAEYYNNIQGGSSGSENTMRIIMLVILLVLIVVSVVTTILAGMLLYGICVVEGKRDRIKTYFAKNTEKQRSRIVSILGYLSISFCIFVMFFLEALIKYLQK